MRRRLLAPFFASQASILFIRQLAPPIRLSVHLNRPNEPEHITTWRLLPYRRTRPLSQTASADLKGKAKYSSNDIQDMEHEYSA